MLRWPEAGGDGVWDAAGTGRGICLHLPREASGIKWNSTEHKIIIAIAIPLKIFSGKIGSRFSHHNRIAISKSKSDRDYKTGIADSQQTETDA
jgi:hypothetical protein